MSELAKGNIVGYGFLLDVLQLQQRFPPLPRKATIAAVSAITKTSDGLLVPLSAAPATKSILDHLIFAIKHEGIELAVIRLCLAFLGAEDLQQRLSQTPNSGFLRIIGYLYEAFGKTTLDDIPPIGGSYVNLFDPNDYYTGAITKITRWRVNFNGLGSIDYCPVVRKTEKIQALLGMDILGRANDFYANTEPEVLDRALSWAYLSETEGSFALEKEAPGDDKKTVFVRLLQQAHEPRKMTEDYLVELQNSAVTNPLDQAIQYRLEQNWLRKGGVPGPAGVSYVPPKPEDASHMMDALLRLLNARPAEIDPIMLGAIVSFGFVFIHPFMDGNGRLSRFLMHYTLCQSGRLPKSLILPISVAMKRKERQYLEALVGFSRPIRALWRVSMLDQDMFLCETDAPDYMYRYWDATDCVTFVYQMALNALQNDLARETQFLMAFDATYKAINERIDVRDHDLNNLIMWCLQNNGTVSKKRREQLAHRYKSDVFDTVEHWVRHYFPT